jgi:hypothetical protein
MRSIPTPAIAILLIASAPLSAQEYPIKLDRLPKVGSVIEVTSQTAQTGELKTVLSKLTRWGVTGSFRTTATVVARLTVEEADPSGWATKASLKVLRFDVVSGNRKTATDIQGKVFQLSVHKGRRRYLEPTGKPGESYVLDEPRADVLDLALPLRFMKGEVGLDAMFGAQAPQRVGATWKADPQALATAFSHWHASRERSQGAAVIRKAVGKILTLETTLSLTGLSFPDLIFNLPADYTLSEAKHEMQITTAVSSEESALPSAQAIKLFTTASGILKGVKESEWYMGTGQSRYKLVK